MCRLQIPRTLPPQNLIADLLSSFSHLLWTCYRRFSTCSAIGRKAAQPPQNTATLAPEHIAGEIGRFTLFLQVENARDPFRRTASTTKQCRQMKLEI
jgi:hypothetical protein